MSPSLRPITNLLRTTARQSERLARAVAGEATGIVSSARSRRGSGKPGMDDRTLAAKVQSELFRPRGTPKGDVDIDVVEGVVYLRGQVKRPAQVKELEARARAIGEVRGVENLLHLPDTPSPTRADSPRSAQKTPRSPRPAPRKRTAATRTRTTGEIPKGPAGTRRTSQASGASAGTAESPEAGGGATARTGTTRSARTGTARARTAAKRAGTTRPAAEPAGRAAEPAATTAPPATAAKATPELPSAVQSPAPEPDTTPEQSGPGASATPAPPDGSEQS